MRSQKILALILSAAMVLTLAACDNGGNNEPADNTTSSGNDQPDNTDNNEADNTTDNTADDANTDDNTAQLPPTADNSYTLTILDANDTSYADGVEDTEYVIADGITDKMIALSELNLGNQVRLADVMKRAEAGEEITVAYIGGSITQGSSAGDNDCYARLTTNWFEQTFPDAAINYVRAGIGATGSYIGVHRVDTDVISHNPDLVFVEFSVNDTTENTQRNVNSYDSLLRKIWNADSSPAIVCIGMTQDNGTSFQSYHYSVAAQYDLPFISYKNAILHVINEGYIKWTDISDDNIHPNTAGHKVLTEIITHYLAKVNENKDSVSGDESDFSTPATKDVYANAALLTPANCGATDETNTIKANKDGAFGGFNGYWMARVGAEGFGGAKLVFENVEAKNIGLLYGEIVGKGPMIDIYLDGVLVNTVDANFPGGWGNYTEAVEIIALQESGTHTVEIVPQDTGDSAILYVTGLAIS